jgi:osmotically-inducible protein OsmY
MNKAAWLATLALVACAPLIAFAQQGDASAARTTKSASNGKSADRALQKQVRAVLAKDKKINAANIVVRARSGAVTLEGNVPTQDELSRAEEVAKGVSGVNSVNNALTIRQPGQ